jgi:hypothetical protein
MKDSQFPDTEFGNALKEKVNRSESVYREYITQNYEGYEQVCKIPKEVALLWVQLSPAFTLGLLKDGYMVFTSRHPDFEDSATVIGMMNKGAIRVDDGNDSYYNEVWVYKHDFSYWVVKPRRR